MIPFFFLPIDKPAGMTSHDVVSRIRKALRAVYPRQVKVGHTGTLDPFASGLLLLAVGKATRFADDVHLLPKSYSAEFSLGMETDTLDCDGEMTERKPVPSLNENDLETVATQFLGEILQIPPSYSAKKVDGVRSYRLARNQAAKELQPCKVQIHYHKLMQLDPERLACEVTCGTGTYIRSLGRDVAAALGTVGHVSKLRRVSVGAVTVDRALPLGLEERVEWPTVERHALSVPEVLPSIPQFDMPLSLMPPLLNGRAVNLKGEPPFGNPFIAVFKSEEGTQAVIKCSFDSETEMLMPNMLCYQKETMKKG